MSCAELGQPTTNGDTTWRRSGDNESGIRVSEVDCCSGHENGGAFKPAGAEIGQGLVGLAERVAGGLGDDADLRDETQEIESILPREIGDRHELDGCPPALAEVRLG